MCFLPEAGKVPDRQWVFQILDEYKEQVTGRKEGRTRADVCVPFPFHFSSSFSLPNLLHLQLRFEPCVVFFHSGRWRGGHTMEVQ